MGNTKPVITKQHLEQLDNIREYITDIVYKLDRLGNNEEMTIGHIMFHVGAAHEMADKCESKIIDLLEALGHE